MSRSDSAAAPPRRGTTTLPRRMDFARASTLLTAGELAGVAVGFASTVYFARELGAAALGVFFLFDAVLNTLATVADFGLRGAVEKRVSEAREPAPMLGAALALKLGAVAVVSLPVLAFRGPLNAYVGARLAGPLLLALLCYEAGQLTLHVLRGELRVAETAVLSLARLLVYVAVAVALVVAGYGLRALVYALVTSYAALAVVGWLRMTTPVGRPRVRHLRSLAGYAKFNGVSALGGYVYNSMDVLVVGYFLTPTAVAAYELAWRVSLLASIVPGAVSNALFPQLSAWLSDGETDRVTATLTDAFTAALALALPAFAGVVVLADPLLGTLFGPAYTVAAAAFVVLMAEKLVAGLNTVFDAAARAFDRPQAGAYATALSLSLNVALNLALVPRFGLVGAAVATALSVLANALALGWYLRRLTTVRFAARELGWCVAASAAMGAVLLGLSSVVALDSLGRVFGAVALGGAVYLGLLALSPALRRKARSLVGTR